MLCIDNQMHTQKVLHVKTPERSMQDLQKGLLLKRIICVMAELNTC